MRPDKSILNRISIQEVLIALSVLTAMAGLIRIAEEPKKDTERRADQVVLMFLLPLVAYCCYGMSRRCLLEAISSNLTGKLQSFRPRLRTLSRWQSPVKDQTQGLQILTQPLGIRMNYQRYPHYQGMLSMTHGRASLEEVPLMRIVNFLRPSPE